MGKIDIEKSEIKKITDIQDVSNPNMLDADVLVERPFDAVFDIGKFEKSIVKKGNYRLTNCRGHGRFDQAIACSVEDLGGDLIGTFQAFPRGKEKIEVSPEFRLEKSKR